MMYSTLTSIILSASVALANAIPVAIAINEDMKLADMTYVGPVTPGGKDYTLVGDAKDIHEQILALNPSYSIDDFNIPAPQDAQLVDRSVVSNQCDVSTRYAQQAATKEGIKHLNSLGAGYCRLGPTVCTRVTCSWNSAIYYCNLLGYGMAQRGLDKCANSSYYLSSKVADQGNYYILIVESNQFGEGKC
ncbi:hypothetical protein V490_05438 [Pseudogymnoascus sp. VKM F-3557]|nr:hypothetical protein V490_05438 [Pseudogymnoascus sp. VKM F-3557]